MRHARGPTFFIALALVFASSPWNAAAGASATPREVPWVNRPATSGLLTSLSPRPLRAPAAQTNAPPCTAAALRMSVGVLQWSQNGGVALDFRNSGSATCLLRGVPRVVATESGERDVVATTAPLPTFADVANTPPGASVAVEVSAPLVCATNPGGSNQNSPVYHRLLVTMPGGATTALRGLTLRFPCGMSVTPFLTPKPAVRYAVFPMAHLVPHVRLPSSVRPDSTLIYSVELSNPLGRAVALSPCPAYIEHSSLGTKLEYQLNCTTVRVIPAHRSVWYQMKMPFASTAHRGLVAVYWSLTLGPSSQARATLRVN